jgi:FkbM family methyltransferase
MSIKKLIKRIVPEKISNFIRSILYIATHIHHFLSNCFTLVPIKELFVILGGHQRAPQGSENFIKKFFKIIEETTEAPLLVDVGGNEGWFAGLSIRFLRDKKYQLIGYEPLKSQSALLSDIGSKYSNITYNFVAVGAQKGKTEIREFASNGLSSLRDIDKSVNGYDAKYNTNVINKYEVAVVTLDDEITSQYTHVKDIVLKIDTQGYELEVLKGSINLLESGRIKIILIELMTIPKYTSASLHIEILNFLSEYNYSLYDVNRGVYESNGRLSEYDAILIHNSVTI